MDLQKRDCPIKIEFHDAGAGWLDMKLSVDGDETDYSVSGYGGENIDTLLERIYYLHPSAYEPYSDPGVVETVSIDGMTDYGDDVEFEVPYKAEFCWREDDAYSEWKFSHDATLATEFDLNISITKFESDNKTEKKYTVSYREFCYALGKAYTEILKKHGINGFDESYWSGEINLRQLLFIKAIALDCYNVIQPEFNENEEAYSDINKEIEVLMFDM